MNISKIKKILIMLKNRPQKKKWKRCNKKNKIKSFFNKIKKLFINSKHEFDILKQKGKKS